MTWQLFGQTFQSDVISGECIPRPIEDIIQIQCQQSDIINRFVSILPMQLFIRPSLSPDTTNMDYFASTEIYFSEQDVQKQATSMENFTVTCESSWVEFVPSAAVQRWLPRHVSRPQLRVHMTLSEGVLSTPLSPPQPSSLLASSPLEPQKESLLSSVADAVARDADAEADHEDLYDDEQFEKEEESDLQSQLISQNNKSFATKAMSTSSLSKMDP
jgi:hypothetical protein